MGIITDGLNSQIQSNKEKMNQYTADQEKYRQAIVDAKKAKEIFQTSGKTMDSLILETDGVFQGVAATAFAAKLTQYNDAVKWMASVMDSRVSYFEKRIKEIESQKFWCNVWTNILTGWMNSLKIISL